MEQRDDVIKSVEDKKGETKSKLERFRDFCNCCKGNADEVDPQKTSEDVQKVVSSENISGSSNDSAPSSKFPEVFTPGEETARRVSAPAERPDAKAEISGIEDIPASKSEEKKSEETKTPGETGLGSDRGSTVDRKSAAGQAKSPEKASLGSIRRSSVDRKSAPGLSKPDDKLD